MIPADYLSTVILAYGAHAPDGSVCAMEAIACAMGLPHSDAPACTDGPLASVFRRVNDWAGWRTDEKRTKFLRPYLQRLGRLSLAARHAPDAAYAYAATDVACRVIAPMALEAAGRGAAATTLRALSLIVDRATVTDARAATAATYAAAVATAADAVYAAYAAADAAADAAYIAYTATYAAADTAADTAADAAADAAYIAANAANAADAATAYFTAAGALLTRLLDVCEAGCWPLPDNFQRTE